MSSLYERFGGEGPLLAAVHGFYRRLMADPRVNGFFEGLSIEAQATKQLAFMTRVLGGPEVYQGRDLTEAHRHLVLRRGLNDTHFDVVVGHLRATLEEMQVASALVDEIMAVIESKRGQVLGREGASA